MKAGRRYLICFLISVLASSIGVGGVSSVRAAPQYDPSVEELRDILAGPPTDAAKRREDLNQWLAAPHSLATLRRALQLPEWRITDPNAVVASIDRTGRQEIARQFEQTARAELRGGNATRQIALLHTLSEMGRPAPGTSQPVCDLAPLSKDIVQLIQSGEPAVIPEAVRALGRIQPDPAVALPLLTKLVSTGDQPRRLAAAESLCSLMEVLQHRMAASQAAPLEQATRKTVVETGQGVVAAACLGLNDVHPHIRRRCARALQQTTALLRVMAVESDPAANAAAAQVRPLSNEERNELVSLLRAVQNRSAAISQAVGDADREVCLLCYWALEDLVVSSGALGVAGNQGTPPFNTVSMRNGTTVGQTSPVGDAPGQTLAGRLPMLTGALTAKDVRARRAAIDVLEALGAEAAPAAGALVQALADADRFVRWAAARTLGKLAPKEAASAVPALARLLSDPDLDLRLAAATALEMYGASAGSAVTDLSVHASSREPQMALAAMRALESIGPGSASAVPVLIEALRHADGRVRKQAARTLGRLGPAARASVDALRQALQDRNADVREAAGNALLAVQ
jgi:HEAT repeat protein